jgi:general secretion pathway protein G
MAKTKKQRERTIFFPWEKTGSLVHRLGLGRARPLAFGGAVVALFVVLGVRERHMIGIRSTRATIGVVAKAVDAYRADHEGRCPGVPGSSGLAELKTAGYLAFDPVDAWGKPLRLLCPGFENARGYDLMSDGPDGVFGGLDRVE